MSDEILREIRDLNLMCFLNLARIQCCASRISWPSWVGDRSAALLEGGTAGGAAQTQGAGGFALFSTIFVYSGTASGGGRGISLMFRYLAQIFDPSLLHVLWKCSWDGWNPTVGDAKDERFMWKVFMEMRTAMKET